jgi:hypothetical protein
MSYYNEAIIKHIVTNVAEGSKEEYTKFFNSALKKFDVKSPAALDDDKKKEFFNYIEKNYKGDDAKEAKINKLRNIIKGITKEEIQKLYESTDVFDYNEIAIEQLMDAVDADAKAWMRTENIMENEKTRGMVEHARKNGIDKVMRKLDRTLRKL